MTVGRDAVRLEKAKQSGKPMVATITGTRRDSAQGSTRTFAVRTDGVAGCLLCRTKRNRQRVLLIDGDRLDTRYAASKLQSAQKVCKGSAIIRGPNETASAPR
jgi:hypothetical protein